MDPKRHTRLQTVIKELGKYYGVSSKSQFINTLIELNDNPPATGEPDLSREERIKKLNEKPPQHLLGDFFLTATEGAHTTATLLEEIEKAFAGNNASLVDEYKNLIQIVWDPAQVTGATAKKFLKPICNCTAAPNGHSSAYDYDDKGAIGAPVAAAEASGIYAPFAGNITPTMISQPIYEKFIETHGKRLPADDGQPAYPAYDQIKQPNSTSDPGADNPVVVNFLINDPELSPSTKDAGAVSLFLAHIPSLEMSRCQVYFDVNVITQRPPVEGPDEKISTMSLSQFLDGRRATKDDNDEQKITTRAINSTLLANPEFATPDDQNKIESNELPNLASAGMELFTAPQTLVDADEVWTLPDMSAVSPDAGLSMIEKDRTAQVMDRFRPLATLTGFSIGVTPSGGMMTHKTAEITLTLHDRSRIAEVSELIRPDMYGKTSLLIEYGWMHPEALDLSAEFSNNPFAHLIDAFRNKEKYKVKNSSFSFTETGEVEITVELFTSTGMIFDSVDISKGPGVGNKLKRFQDLANLIRHLRRKVTPPKDSGSSDVTGFTWLGSLTSPGGIANMDKDTKKAMDAWMKAARRQGAGASPSTKELLEAIKKIKDEYADLTATINQALQLKDDHIRSPASGDPWWEPILHDEKETKRGSRTVYSYHCNVRQHVADPRFTTSVLWDRQKRKDCVAAYGGKPKENTLFKRNFPKQYVSLGKLLSTYVIGPLAAEDAFDEVQVFYYTFNEHASYMADRNISSFPIEYGKFKEELEKITRTSANVPIRRFLGMIQSKFLSKSWNPAYGMSSFYQADKEQGMKLKQTYEKNPATLSDEKNAVLARAYFTDPEGAPEGRQKFKKPRLAVSTEVKPAMNHQVGGLSANQQTILKIHIYDKASSPHSSMQDLLKAARRDSMGTINTMARSIVRTPATDATAKKRNEKKALLETTLESSTIFEKASGDEGAYKIKGGFPAIKNFIKSTMPSIIYGSANSGVISASVSSMNDPQLATIHMMREGNNEARTPSQQLNSGLPLRTMPVEVSLTIFGCPLVEFGQQFFIDFGTGTTLDNVYAITGISHSLTQGEFTTELTMVQLDAYGAYESALNLINQAQPTIEDAVAAE